MSRRPATGRRFFIQTLHPWHVKRLWATIREAFKGFGRHKVPRLAAALAYYTLFSLAPLLVIIIAIVGLVFGSEEARAQLVSQLEATVGGEAADQVSTMIESTQRTGNGLFATLVGVGTLLIGATGVFVQLQTALNEIWEVEPGERKGVMRTLMLRLEGLGIMLALAVAATLGLVLQAAVTVVTNYFDGLLPGSEWLWFLANLALTLGIYTLVFAALFKYVPDVRMRWSEVWRGALLTAVLFKIGEFALSYYLSTAGVSSTYGAAGALVVLVLFIYYAAQILLFGAEFTRADVSRHRVLAGEDERFERKPRAGKAATPETPPPPGRRNLPRSRIDDLQRQVDKLERRLDA